jgi:hypothetical protein
VDNPGGDPQAGYLGAGIASVVAENFEFDSGPHRSSARARLPRGGDRRNDLRALQTELSADYVVDLALRTTSPAPSARRALRRPTAAPDWEQSITAAIRSRSRESLLDGIGHAPKRAVRSAPAEAVGTGIASAGSERRAAGADGVLGAQRRCSIGSRSRATSISAIDLLNRATTADRNSPSPSRRSATPYWDKYLNEEGSGARRQATDAVLQAIRLDPDHAAGSLFAGQHAVSDRTARGRRELAATVACAAAGQRRDAPPARTGAGRSW